MDDDDDDVLTAIPFTPTGLLGDYPFDTSGSYIRRTRGFDMTMPRPGMRRSRTSRLFIEVSDPFVAVEITAAMQNLLRTLASSTSARDSGSQIEEVLSGSIFIRFKRFMRTLLGSKEAKQLADQVRQGLEANLIEKAQSEIGFNIASGMAALMSAAKDADSLAADIGQFQLAKVTDEDGKSHWRAKAFTSRELASLHLSDEQLRNPHEFFDSLAPDPEQLRQVEE